MRHGLFILSHFIYNVLPLLYTFSSFMFIPHCTYFLSCIFFFLSSCTRNLAHKSQCCKYTLTEPHAPTMHVTHTPSTADAFSGRNNWRLKIGGVISQAWRYAPASLTRQLHWSAVRPVGMLTQGALVCCNRIYKPRESCVTTRQQKHSKNAGRLHAT